MDVWMVVVAAGAGYIAQHFKKCKQVGEPKTSESSIQGSYGIKPDSPKQPSDKKWPFRVLSKRKSLESDDFEVKDEASASDLDGEKEVMSGIYEGSDGNLGDVGKGDLVNEPSTRRSRMSFRSRRTSGRVIRPLSSLESCVMAHVEMKKYASSSFASPSMQTVRPFYVTDGSNVISRANNDAFIVQKGCSVEKKLQSYSEEFDRSPDATLLVCLGMSFGILYSFMANKREVEKLNRLLKQSENLVQDLEEELQMKDSLILQELTIEDHESQRIDGGSFNDGSPHSVTLEHDNNDSVVIKDESFTKIEAELEAELEMLELNMTSSTLERKISNLAELDPDFEPGLAQGELRADMLGNTNEDEEGSTATLRSANYAVSPRELSLRLHEILQSQLEERIRELEAQIETRNHKSWKDFSSSDAGDDNPFDKPVVLNLSGEALDAYNEACNEFAKLDESDEDMFSNDSGIVESRYLQHLDVDATPRNGGGGSGGYEQGFDDDDDDDDNDNDDEMEKLLIKHIVEKARQGSPVVLNAQRALFSE